MTAAVLIVHAAATLMMAGLIWFVQLVHYPLLARVGPGALIAYERMHMQRTTWIVAPLMLTELAAALALPLVVETPVAVASAWAGLLLIAVIWTSTALLQVPCHRRLSAAPDPDAIRRLVTTNWLRTLAWTARAGLALTLIAGA